MPKKRLSTYFNFKFNTFDIVFLALLLGLNVVFTMMPPINLWNSQYSFGFIPIALAAYYYGCAGGIIVAALGDILGTLIAPIGAYFPGFTFSAALTGIIFGLFFYAKPSIIKTVAAVIINQIICSLLLNSYFISLLYTPSFLALLATRTLQCVIMAAIQITLLILIINLILKRIKLCHFYKR